MKTSINIIDDYKDFVEFIGNSWTVLLAIFALIFGIFKFLKKHFRRLKDSKNLDPFFSKEDIKDATKYFVQTRFQNVSASNYDEPIESHAYITTKRLLSFFIKVVFNRQKAKNKFFMILADSGMGKTTFMLNLYIRYKKKIFREYDIKLFPLAHDKIDLLIENEDSEIKKKTILLLDAFDEDPRAISNSEERLNEIVQKSSDYKFIIITCRTQFFENDKSEPYQTKIKKFTDGGGFQTFGKLYVSPFTEKEINSYLNKRYPLFKTTLNEIYPFHNTNKQFNNLNKEKAKQIVNGCLDLMVRPMLLSYIDTLVEDKEQVIRDNYEIYDLLVSRWIERESYQKQFPFREKFKLDLLTFTKKVAIFLYELFKSEGRLYLTNDEIAIFEGTAYIELSSLEMKNKSLLTRNSRGDIKFSHKSIWEFFLVKEMFENEDFWITDFSGLDFALELYSSKIFKYSYNIDILDEFRIKHLLNIKNGIFKNWLKENPNEFEVNLSSASLLPLNLEKNNSIFDITSLSLVYSNIINVKVLVKFKNLKKLNLNMNNIINIEPLSVLTGLQILDLGGNGIENIEPLSTLTNLSTLTLSRNKIIKITALSKLSNLLILDLRSNKINNIEPLFLLTGLRILYLNNNSISKSDIDRLRRKLFFCTIYA